MSRKPNIRVIGSLNIDFVTLTPRVPGPGETLTATSLSVNAGGKGANQAVACGRAAFTTPKQQDVVVEMIGAVGRDDPYYSSLLRPTLEKSGVATTGVAELQGSQTGTATILVDEGAHGENRIMVVPGANFDGMSDLNTTLATSTGNKEDWPDVVVMQGEIPRATVLGLLELFNAAEVKTEVILNPAPVFPEGVPIEALQGLAVLVVNETECMQLASSLKGVDVKITDPEEMNLETLTHFAKGFHQVAGIKQVLVTLGAKGVFYSDGQHQELLPAVKVAKVVDTTAAGDTFVGFFATALARHLAKADGLEGFDISAAVRKATEASAKCVQRMGAMQSIPFGYE